MLKGQTASKVLVGGISKRFAAQTMKLGCNWTTTQLHTTRYYSQRKSQHRDNVPRNDSVKVDVSLLEISRRNKDIDLQCDRYYPSMTQLQHDKGKRTTIHDFRNKFGTMDEGMLQEFSDATYTLYGRIQSIRSSGKKIWFLDINDHSNTVNAALVSSNVQIIINYKSVQDKMTIDEFNAEMNNIRKHDYIGCVGAPGLSQSRNKNLSLLVKCLPQLMAPIQTPLPSGLSESQKRNNNRVIDYQVNGIQPLIQRATILRLIRTFYQDLNQFIEVETPLLSSKANGASAKPFAVKHKDSVSLELRIAPELWLKRLIISGMSKVFEMGKMFRNEGIDASHNPEFTMLESYQTYATMEDLIELAESLFKYLLLNVTWENDTTKALKETLQANDWHFNRIEFLPTLSKELGISLESVNLDEPREIMAVLPEETINTLSLLDTMSSSQILDKLSGYYLEDKHCQSLHPTIIYHQPLAMSPLAKSIPTKPRLTQRFEMFIKGKEYINAYEEENCPQTQLSNFLQQQKQSHTTIDPELLPVDHKYVEAMRSGMPPTGGLGLGVDRLCMLLMEKSRIEQVLPFGSIDDVNRQ
ncbi:lysine--tRNA ligase, mitochondrial [Monosporozyma unispora]